jgi:acetyl esterase/lipase
VHGGGYMAPIDPFHVRYATRLADAIGARVVMPDYPLAPEHTWKDSHDALVDDAARWAGSEGGAVLAGDSAAVGSRCRWRCRCATAAWRSRRRS